MAEAHILSACRTVIDDFGDGRVLGDGLPPQQPVGLTEENSAVGRQRGLNVVIERRA